MEGFPKNPLLVFLRKNLLVLSLASLGMIFFIYGLISLSVPASDPNDVQFITTEPVEKEIFVDVEGAVIKPGVYRLRAESRVQDALVAASGIADDSDRLWISRNLNLAARLTDGVKIYVPRRGEEMFSQGTEEVISAFGTGSISINQATQKELEELPGIGPVTAKKIIDQRPYSSLDDVLRSVPSSVYEKIKDKISL